MDGEFSFSSHVPTILWGERKHFPGEQAASWETGACPSCLPGKVAFLIGTGLWENSNAHARLCFPKQISSTSSRFRPPPPWIKGRVSSTAAPVLLRAPPSSLAFEPSSVRLFPKLVGARTHLGHLSPALSSHRLAQACSIHNFCHFSSTMCIYMHICTQTRSPPSCLSPLALLLPPLPFPLRYQRRGLWVSTGSLVNHKAIWKLACDVDTLVPGPGWLVPWPGDLVHSLPCLGYHWFSFVHAAQGRVFSKCSS